MAKIHAIFETFLTEEKNVFNLLCYAELGRNDALGLKAENAIEIYLSSLPVKIMAFTSNVEESLERMCETKSFLLKKK